MKQQVSLIKTTDLKAIIIVHTQLNKFKLPSEGCLLFNPLTKQRAQQIILIQKQSYQRTCFFRSPHKLWKEGNEQPATRNKNGATYFRDVIHTHRLLIDSRSRQWESDKARHSLGPILLLYVKFKFNVLMNSFNETGSNILQLLHQLLNSSAVFHGKLQGWTKTDQEVWNTSQQRVVRKASLGSFVKCNPSETAFRPISEQILD